MATLMTGAIILGCTSSWVLGFVPFFLALMISVVLGVGMATIRGAPLGDLPLPGLTLLVTAQLAYGLGLVGQYVVSRLGGMRDGLDSGRASPVSLGEAGGRTEKVVDPAQNRLG